MKRRLEEGFAGRARLGLGRAPIARACATVLLLAAVYLLLGARQAAAQTSVFLKDLTDKEVGLEASADKNANGEYVFWVEFLSDGKDSRTIEFPQLPSNISVEEKGKEESRSKFTFKNFLLLKFTVSNLRQEGMKLPYVVTPGFDSAPQATDTLVLKPLSLSGIDERRINTLATQLAAKQADEIVKSKQAELLQTVDKVGTLATYMALLLFMVLLILAAVITLLWLRRRNGRYRAKDDDGEDARNADPPLLSVNDLINPNSLALKLRSKDKTYEYFSWEALSTETKSQLDQFKKNFGLRAASSLPERLQERLVTEFNQFIIRHGLSEFYRRFDGKVAWSDETRRLIEQSPQGNDRIRLDRMILADAFPDEIAMPSPDNSGSATTSHAPLIEKLENLHGELQKGVKAILSELKFDVKEDVQEALKNPPKLFLQNVTAGVEQALSGDELRMHNLIATFEEVLLQKFETVADRLMGATAPGGGLNEKGVEDQRKGAALTGTGAAGVSKDKQPDAVEAAGERGVTLSEEERRQIHDLFKELKDAAVVELDKGMKAIGVDLLNLRRDQLRFLETVRGANLNKSLPVELQAEAGKGRAIADDKVDDTALHAVATSETPQVGQTSGHAPGHDPGAVEAEGSARPEADANWADLYEAERQKIQRREEAAEAFIQELSKKNEELAGKCAAWLKIGRDENQNFLRKLDAQKFERSAVPGESEWNLGNFQKGVIRPFVTACGKELKDLTGMRLESELFRELLASVGLTHSWPQENDKVNPDQHEPVGRADNFKAFHEPEGNRLVAEVLWPCVFAAGQDETVEKKIFLKAGVKTT